MLTVNSLTCSRSKFNSIQSNVFAFKISLHWMIRLVRAWCAFEVRIMHGWNGCEIILDFRFLVLAVLLLVHHCRRQRRRHKGAPLDIFFVVSHWNITNNGSASVRTTCSVSEDVKLSKQHHRSTPWDNAKFPRTIKSFLDGSDDDDERCSSAGWLALWPSLDQCFRC